MSNLTIFDPKQLELLLEPFAPGMAAHITPIKYEALSPDCFLLLFRTTGRSDEDHYFVSLETDSQSSLDGARCDIESWHDNEIIAFWPLDSKRDQEESEDIDNYKAQTSGPYFALLAEVKRPTHKGYWAEAITILPGDTITEKIKSYPENVQANIRESLATILEHKLDPDASFLDSLRAKKQDTIVNDINQTDMAVSLYVQPDGNVESFYNYVHKTMHRKPGKPKQPE